MNELQRLRGVGPAVEQRLHALGLRSLNDLLTYWPSRYDDFSKVVAVASAPLATPVTVRVRVEKIKTRPAWRRRRLSITEATVRDDSGSLKVIWFNQSYIGEQLKIGEQLFLAGKVTEDKYGRHLTNPIFERYKPETMHTARIVPRYSLTYGLTQKQLRFFIKQALEQVQHGRWPLLDWLPETVRSRYDLLPLAVAVKQIHFPDDDAQLTAARYRLGFDELLPLQLFVRRMKQTTARAKAVPLPFQKNIIQNFVKKLPFNLTAKQRQVAWQILQDLEQERPMNRLLEGDVGAGKTVIALLAMIQTVRSGYQALLMAPTELLAEQHWQTICRLLDGENITVRLATSHHRKVWNGASKSDGDEAGSEAAGSNDDPSSETADIIIGTQALLYSAASLSKVALAVIDEQHRFGVRQRQSLQERAKLNGKMPHLLSLTATPIPRSLALVLYGDLDISILDEFPPGRIPIQTQFIGPNQRRSLYAQVRKCIANGEQIYIVAPRIAPDDDEETPTTAPTSTTEITSVETEFANWQKHLPGVRLGKLHGQLPAAAKQQIMEQFRRGQLDALVTTTVIEVGVDVPRATVMVIADADRFGLAQLHQLRGRVGRSDKASYCYVCCAEPSAAALERLQFFVQTNDGFALAEFDLASRGPGQVYGQEQSGFLTSLKIARLTDQKLLKAVSAAADDLWPQLNKYPALTERVNNFINSVHLE